MSNFCISCGARLNPDDVYCESCGALIEPSPVQNKVDMDKPIQDITETPTQYAATRPAQEYFSQHTQLPLAKTTPPWVKWAIVGVGVAFIAIIAVLIIFLQKPTETDANQVSSTNTTLASPQPPQNEITNASFVGRWLWADGQPGENNTFEFKEQSGMLIATIGNGIAQLEMKHESGRTIKGIAIDNERNERIPVTAELSEDSNKLVFTFAPPASEYVTRVAWREGYKPDSIDTPPTKTEESSSFSGGSTSANLVSDEEDAIAAVKNKADVLKWYETLRKAGKEKNARIDVDSEENDKYIVHVYEVVQNYGEPSHTATFGWFEVEKKTGFVKSIVP